MMREAISRCDVSPESVCKMLDATLGDATVEEVWTWEYTGLSDE